MFEDTMGMNSTGMSVHIWGPCGQKGTDQVLTRPKDNTA